MSVREAPAWRKEVPRSLSISPGLRKAYFYQPKPRGAVAFGSASAAHVIGRRAYPARKGQIGTTKLLCRWKKSGILKKCGIQSLGAAGRSRWGPDGVKEGVS